MRKKYQSKAHKSNHKFEAAVEQQLSPRMSLPMAELWAEMQTKLEELAGQAGLAIPRAIPENDFYRPGNCPGCKGEARCPTEAVGVCCLWDEKAKLESQTMGVDHA